MRKRCQNFKFKWAGNLKKNEFDWSGSASPEYFIGCRMKKSRLDAESPIFNLLFIWIEWNSHGGRFVRNISSNLDWLLNRPYSGLSNEGFLQWKNESNELPDISFFIGSWWRDCSESRRSDIKFDIKSVNGRISLKFGSKIGHCVLIVMANFHF